MPPLLPALARPRGIAAVDAARRNSVSEAQRTIILKARWRTAGTFSRLQGYEPTTLVNLLQRIGISIVRM
jgi:hypothetical protein